ncbi:hypothetical protein DMENIID0001_117200 [Sergentomyia squamirostris]
MSQEIEKDEFIHTTLYADERTPEVKKNKEKKREAVKMEKIANLHMINDCWRDWSNRSRVPISTHSSFFADN